MLIEIKSRSTPKTDGQYDSVKSAVEAAAQAGASLCEANLADADLREADLPEPGTET